MNSDARQTSAVPERPCPDRRLHPQARMNGGTSIAAAIQKAGQLLKGIDRAAAAADDDDGEEEGPEEGAVDEDSARLLAQSEGEGVEPGQPGARVLVLLTDGRVDSYQVPRSRACQVLGSCGVGLLRRL